MYKKLYNTILILGAVASLLSSCDSTIHEYPRPMESEVIIETHIDRNPPLYYKEVVYNQKWERTVNDLDPKTTPAYIPADGYSMRLILDIYRTSSTRTAGSLRQGERVARHVMELDKDALPPQNRLQTRLPDGDYCVLGWADYVHKGQTEDNYYSAPTLLNVLSNYQNYPTDIHLKNCAAGQHPFTLDLNLGPEGYPLLPNVGVQRSRVIPVMLSRTVARYTLVASDYSAFVQDGGKLNGGKVKVTYRQYVSVGYDVSQQEPNEFISSYSFERPLPNDLQGTQEIILLQDYLLASSQKEDNVIVDLYFYNANGKEISRCTNVEIPLMRNHETVVKAPFLTKKIDNGGQVSIDENFDGEHIVEI